MEKKTDLLDWLDRLLLQPGGWIQLLVILGCILLGFGVRLSLSVWMKRMRARTEKKIWQYLLDSVIVHLPVLTPFLALVFIHIAHITMDEYDVPADAIRFGGKMVFIWLVLQAILCFVGSIFARISLVVIAGIFFALDIFDYLKPALEESKKIAYNFGQIKITLYGVLNSVVALIVLIWIAGAVQRGSERILNRLSLRGSTQQLVLKTLTVTLYCVVGLIALSILGVSIGTLTVFSGAVGVGIGFGLQKIASNFVSGVILLMEKSIEVNDQIIMGDVTGYVRRTGARFTLIDSDDGRALLVPNENFITQTVVNLTHLGRRGKLDLRVYVAYESDLRLVREIILKHVKAESRVMVTPAPSCFIANFKEGFVEMVAYYWVADITKGKLGLQTEILMGVMDDFRAYGIALPTPFATRYLDKEGSYQLARTGPEAVAVSSDAHQSVMDAD